MQIMGIMTYLDKGLVGSGSNHYNIDIFNYRCCVAFAIAHTSYDRPFTAAQ